MVYELPSICEFNQNALLAFMIAVIERYNDPNTAMKMRGLGFIILDKVTYLH